MLAEKETKVGNFLNERRLGAIRSGYKWYKKGGRTIRGHMGK